MPPWGYTGVVPANRSVTGRSPICAVDMATFPAIQRAPYPSPRSPPNGVGRSATRYSVLLRGTLDLEIMNCQQMKFQGPARLNQRAIPTLTSAKQQ
jgi:hypothetical protein